MENDIPTRVAKGVALLDEKKPGWVGLINLADLQLCSSEHCVLGQTYGDYWNGLRELGFYDEDMNVIRVDDADYGFDAYEQKYGRGPEFSALQAEWVRVLAVLRQKNEAKVEPVKV